MRKIKNEEMAQLLMQVRFAPARQRQKQLDRAEELLSIIEQDKPFGKASSVANAMEDRQDREYPFEFICYKITGYRPEGDAGHRLIKGDELADDLRVFIWKLSGQVAPPATEQSEEIYTTKQLARKMHVSTKTIDRWRKRGLKFRKYIYEDKRKRMGFLQSTVDEFLAGNPALAEKLGRFTRMSEDQKQKIIERACSLSVETKMSMQKILNTIADETGKGHETIRYVLLNYQKSNPEGAARLRQTAGVLGPADAAEMDRMHKQGADIRELMKRFRRSRCSIYRILKHRRAQALLAKKIDYVPSDEFVMPDAAEKIPGRLPERGHSPVLSREEEMGLFRRYNFLKYRAHIIREQIKTGSISSGRLEEIEKCLAEAEAVKKTIIEANLRLVVSVANKHTITGANIGDLVSQGNVSLMRAVEKFDYTKGFRFSTYASWAISKDFAHRLPGQKGGADKITTDISEFQREARTGKADFAAVERARSDLIQVIRNELESREQYIIINHFGLEGTLVKKNKKTLKQIGDDLGLSKERARQIELNGLQKLRQSLSPELFDLLTG
jgi:RNA polymerase sigma factor (sigma-70 family)